MESSLNICDTIDTNICTTIDIKRTTINSIQDFIRNFNNIDLVIDNNKYGYVFRPKIIKYSKSTYDDFYDFTVRIAFVHCYAII